MFKFIFTFIIFVHFLMMQATASEPLAEKIARQEKLTDVQISPLKNPTKTETILIEAKNEKQKTCQLVGKKSDVFVQELKSLENIKDLVAQKFCTRDGTIPAVIQLAKLKFALKDEQLLVFKKANGQAVADLKFTNEQWENMGRQFGLMHKNNAEFIKETEDGKVLIGVKTLIHGDLHLGNIFYEPENGIFTLIDYETMKRDDINTDIYKIIWRISTGFSCEAAQHFSDAYLSTFDGLPEIQPIVEIWLKAGMFYQGNCMKYPDYKSFTDQRWAQFRSQYGEEVQLHPFR